MTPGEKAEVWKENILVTGLDFSFMKATEFSLDSPPDP
jgi:hypothetical protein